MEGRFLNGIAVVTELPDVIIGGNGDENRFQQFSKETLIAAINNLIKARKHGITLTGLTGSTITHPEIIGRKILSIIIDDFTRNTKFIKGNENSIESDQVILTDNFLLTEAMTITINFE